MKGPAWLGIGAQRCGTTWFVDLITQHPDVSLVNGEKELQALHLENLDMEGYAGLFSSGKLVGEFTPRYLRSMNAIGRAQEVLRDAAPIVVVLRDPIDRFASGMRLRLDRLNEGGISHWPSAFSDQQWAGMYADQLDAWAAAFGHENILVYQYERVMENPQVACNSFWERLDLNPVRLRNAEKRSKTSARSEWQWPPGLHENLRNLYAHQVERLVRYGIDGSRWRNFS